MCKPFYTNINKNTMRTENVVIEKFEYRGYKVEIIEGTGYIKGKPYCWSYKTEGVCSFNGSDNNPTDYDEMIAFVKKELDGKPECIWIKPYDRNNKPKIFSLTNDIETKRRFIINDFEKQFYSDCEGVKWVINLPAECLDMSGYCSLRYYPRLIQHNGFEIWFEFNLEYNPKDKDYALKFLAETFKKMECKPVFNDGNMYWQHFNLNHNSYFTDEYDLEIRDDHPRHGNKYVKFFINPDYTEPNALHNDDAIKIYNE